MESTFETILDRDGTLVYKTRGVSMQPMLHENRDLVIIEKPQGRLKPYDVALYRRGKDYVLHRVLEVREHDYVIRGDNTYSLEYIPAENVIGVLKAFVRKGRRIEVTDPGYLRYARAWHKLYPLRTGVMKVWYKALSIGSKVNRKLPRPIRINRNN